MAKPTPKKTAAKKAQEKPLKKSQPKKPAEKPKQAAPAITVKIKEPEITNPPANDIAVNVSHMGHVAYEQLRTYERNGLKIREVEDVTKLVNAIVNRGFNFPIYVWEGHRLILDGDGRMLALDEIAKQGHTIPPLPVVYIKADTQKEAMVMVLQASSHHGKMTQDSVGDFIIDAGIEIESIVSEIHLPNISYTWEDGSGTSQNSDDEPEGDEDSVPKTPKVTKTVNGDVYELGPHRLICGDSEILETYNKLMGDFQADLILTDPPYGVNYKGGKLPQKGISNDDLGGEALESFLGGVMLNWLTVAKEGAGWYIWHPGANSRPFSAAIEGVGKKIAAQIIWKKNRPAAGWGDYRYNHEPCFYCKGEFYAGRDQFSVWEVSVDEEKYKHPTQKPVLLFDRCITNSSKKGDIVLDPFGGSGTTIISAAKHGRRAMVIELDPSHCDGIVARFAKLFPGQTISRNGVEIDGNSYITGE